MKSSIVKTLFLLFLTLIYFGLTAQEKSNYFTPEIVLFEAKDMGRRTFTVQVRLHKNDYRKYYARKKDPKTNKITDEKVFFIIRINGTKTHFVNGTAYWPEKDHLEWEVIALKDPLPGKAKIELLDRESNLLNITEGIIPDLRTGVNEQPIIKKLEPAGGTLADNISILGKNFGNDTSKIYIFILDDAENEQHLFAEKELGKASPLYLTTRENKGIKEVLEEVRFTIPRFLFEDGDKLDSIAKYLWGKTVKIYVLSSYRRSNLVTLSILPKYWKLTSGIFSILVTFAFLAIIALVFKKLNYFPNILLDSKLGTYSLAKFQSFAWTVVLIGSYFYVAISKIVLTRSGELPDFKVSLIALMGISYGGLVASNYLDKKVPNNRLMNHKPQWKDLFLAQGSEIDMAKLQLFGFTMIAIIAYLFNLFLANALEGLPEIPPTLHMLLITSQGGYIGGKAVSDRLTVNIVEPSEVFAGESKTIQLLGSGFSEGMKVLVEGEKAIPVKFIDPATVEFECSAEIPPGEKSLTLIPVVGQNLLVENALNIQAKQEQTTEEDSE